MPARHDIVLGVPVSPFPDPVVRLTPADQAHHATVWGRTGSGKSRLLQSIFLQHLSKGHGVCLIEPHNDLSLDTVAYLVERGYFRTLNAFDGLMYLDWGNGLVVPFNVLAGSRNPQTTALQTLQAMIRVWPELRRAPTFQTLFLSGLVTLIANDLPITALHRLLSDVGFRQRCLRRVNDPLILQALERFGKVSGQAQEAGSALRRAFLLSFNEVTRLSLGQPDCIVDFRKLMDAGVSLIINLGTIGDAETRKLIGALLLVQIEQAALSRTDLPRAARRPWTVLIDEWPSFAAVDASVGTILEQTRKFGLRLYLAAQSTGQIAADRLEAALENCRLNIVFGLGRESAMQQSRSINVVEPLLYEPDPFTGRPHRIGSGEQFERLTQDVQVLPPQEAFVKLDTAPPVRVRTLSVRDARPDAGELRQVIATYKSRYQRTRSAAEKMMAAAASEPAEPAREPYRLFETG